MPPVKVENLRSVYILLFSLAGLFWIRRQARRGRHTWFTKRDDDAS